jgi:hypothetical protein
VTDKESIAKLERILKQLEKIAENTGIAVGTKGSKGETKKRSSLSEEDRVRTEKIANIYKKVLGLGFNQVVADKTAERFRIMLKISPNYYINTEKYLESIKTNIDQFKSIFNLTTLQNSFISLDQKLQEIVTRLDFSNVSNILNDIKNGLSSSVNYTEVLANTQNILQEIKNKIGSTIDYTSIFTNVQTLLSDIRTNLNSSIRDYTPFFINVQTLLNDINAKLSSSINYTPILTNMQSILVDIKGILGSSINYTPILTNMQSILVDIKGILGSSINYTPILTNLETLLTDIKTNLRSSVDYTPSLTNLQTLLTDIKNNTTSRGAITINPNAIKAGVTQAFKVNLGWIDFKTKVLDYIKKKSSSGGVSGVFDMLKNVSGLMLLGTGLVLVVTALAKSGMVDVGQSLKVIGLVTTFIGLLLFLNNKFSIAKNAGKNLGILIGVVVATTLALVGLGKLPIDMILDGLQRLGIVYSALLAIMISIKLVNKYIISQGLNESVKSLALFVGITIATTLLVAGLSYLPLDIIAEGLSKMAIVAAGLYGILFAFKKLKPKDLQDTMKSLAMFVGIVTATLLLTIFFAKVEFEVLLNGLGKLFTVSAVIGSILFLMNKFINPRNVIKSMIGLLMFVGILYFAIIPTLNKLKGFNGVEVIKTLTSIGLAFTAFAFLTRIIGQIVQGGIAQILVGALAMLGLSFVIGYMADNLQKLANKPWMEIWKGLGHATLAVTAFGLVLAGIGAIMLTGVGAALVAAGAAAVLSISYVLGNLADTLYKFAFKPWPEITAGVKAATTTMKDFGLFLAAFGAGSLFLAPFLAIGMVALLGMAKFMGVMAEELVKYNNIDGVSLVIIGEGLKSLGLGLMAMLGGSVAGVGTAMLDTLSSFFGLDPVSQIKKFEKIDADKIYKLGEGVKFLGEGLKMLSSSDMNLTRITDGVIKLTKPLAEFSGSLNQFSDAYAKFEKVKLESDQIFNIQADNGVKQAISEASQRELEIQTEQLVELKKNNMLMEQLVLRSGGSINSIGGFGGSNEGNLNSPSFETKNNYLANMKMMNMTISNA